MSYVNPAVRRRLDAMPAPVQEAVLSLDIKLETPADLTACLERLGRRRAADESAVRRAYSGRKRTS